MADISNNPLNYLVYRGPLHKCCYCETMFISEEFLNKHQKKCIHLTLLVILKSKLQLKRNQSNDDIGQPKTYKDENLTSGDYFCDECFCGFLKLPEYERHMLDQHPFQCGQSDQNYENNPKLQRHITMGHKKGRSFEGEIWEEYFKKKSKMTRLRTHLDEHNLAKSISKNTLNSNLVIHSGELLFSCNLCEKRFTQSHNLRYHLMSHSGEKPFGCNLCEKRFNRQSKLKLHLMTHSGEKPFGCNLCEKRFTQSHNLRYHLMNHSGEKPFGCDQCEKRFTREYTLKLHMLVHSGERPFDCDHCDKNFARKNHLKEHMLKHTGEKALFCEHCDKSFTRKKYLIEHLKIHT